MKNITFAFLSIVCASSMMYAQTPYQLPPKEVVDIIDAPAPPLVTVSPGGTAMALISSTPHPPLALLAEPILRIAGIRINPRLNAAQRTTVRTGIDILQIETGKKISVGLPAKSSVSMPLWSNDGMHLAILRDAETGVELWIADAGNGSSNRVGTLFVNDVIGTPITWMSDNQHLLVSLVPPNRRSAPVAPRVPAGPSIEETTGKVSRMATFQDLLRTSADEDAFEYYATSQLAIVDIHTGTTTLVGKPGMYVSAECSPDEEMLLVTRVMRPFSYRVPYRYFTRSTDVWDRQGTKVKNVAALPISDEIPPQGVATGPRAVEWQPHYSQRLIWVEALDDGDPMKRVPHRDRLMMWDLKLSDSAQEVFRTTHRYQGVEWLPAKDKGLLSEYDRDRRWRTTTLIDLAEPVGSRVVLFDLSVNDAYNDPGQPVSRTGPDGMHIILQSGDDIYFVGRGATPNGDCPFVDRKDLRTKQSERIFRSSPDEYEQFIAFADTSRASMKILTRRESKAAPPNYFLRSLSSGEAKQLTFLTDPAPSLTGLQKKLIKYKREDGVELSGTLYLPPKYERDKRLPVLIWAYPMEYSDASTAGQVRGSANTFTFLRGPSPLFFVTQGYAVLMDATMPVVGDPETMNNTFVKQIVSSAKAAIDVLDSLGVADRSRVLVAGHSYGAFMTANLLAHSDLFAAGIARSGAYNRTLTPFGFQSERRSFWEARDVYMNLSPFTHANAIKKPLLLIHGEADNNSGTFPIQSERFYQAIKANGGTARLVLLPFESHGYTARESVLHVLAEMLNWGKRYAPPVL